jgi:hypothetical protein
MEAGGGKKGHGPFPQDFEGTYVDASQEGGAQGFVLDAATDKFLPPAEEFIPQNIHPLPEGRGKGADNEETQEQEEGEDEETEEYFSRRGGAGEILIRGPRRGFLRVPDIEFDAP